MVYGGIKLLHSLMAPAFRGLKITWDEMNDKTRSVQDLFF